MLVYRDGSRTCSGAALARSLAAALARTPRGDRASTAVDALLRAGELECALADAGDPAAAAAAAATDAAAAHLFGTGSAFHLAGAVEQLSRHTLPARLSVKTPEGYAYYALHPLAYDAPARAAARGARQIAVVGVRSIGTSLGAAVCAALAHDGHPAERISVRPTGHPYGRTLHFDRAQRAFVDRLRSAGARFLVVDEGPGLSGSTLLAVAEAIERAGVAPARIALLCSHAPEPGRLIAANAAARFARYARHAASPPRARDGVDVSAGRWRRSVFGADASRWPPSRGWLERCKWWSREEGWIDKFEGLGPYGEAALERARALADAGFGPEVRAADGGYARYTWLAGRPPCPRDLDRALIDRLAAYCAFRVRAFAVPASSVDVDAFVRMMGVNVAEALGQGVSACDELPLRSPIIPDARMQPYEWRLAAGGLRKLDGHADGEGHLLTGPCDVCWDIAGAAVEWEMDAHAESALVARFARLCGDNVAQRLPLYVTAYCALRVGELTLLLPSADRDEARRIGTALQSYRDRLARSVNAVTDARHPSH